MEALNRLEQRHVEMIRAAGDDPSDWLPERQIERFRAFLASFIAAQPPEIRMRYAAEPDRLASRMAVAAEQAFSRYEQLPRFSELLHAREEVEKSYEAVRRRLDLPPKPPYLVGTINRGLPYASAEIVVIENDSICRELILLEGGLFAYFSGVSQALCHLLGGSPFSAEAWLDAFLTRKLDSVIGRLHPNHPSVQICAAALDTFTKKQWLSTPPDLTPSHEFHRIHELTYGAMVQFVFAHEFAHLGGHLHPGASDIPVHEKEYESDVVALNILSESMRRTVRFPAAFSMWPAWIVLSSMRALSVTRSTDEEPAGDSHPTFAQRATQLMKALGNGAEAKPQHESVMAEAGIYADLAYSWTSALFDFAHEARRRGTLPPDAAARSGGELR